MRPLPTPTPTPPHLRDQTSDLSRWARGRGRGRERSLCSSLNPLFPGAQSPFLMSRHGHSWGPPWACPTWLCSPTVFKLDG